MPQTQQLDLYQADAFTDAVFGGNPAAMVPLAETWPDDDLLQAIARENNLSETAFYIDRGDYVDLRWFTPEAEVDLCGHATLTTAHILWEQAGYPRATIRFATRSGELLVERGESGLTMDFPAAPPEPVTPPESLAAGLGVPAVEICADFDYLIEVDSPQTVANLKPDLFAWTKLDRRGVIVTAAGSTGSTGGDEADFVSRCFYPKLGINEDPATGSAHCILAPYWAAKLNKDRLKAEQISLRGASIACQVKGDRVTFDRASRDLFNWKNYRSVTEVD